MTFSMSAYTPSISPTVTLTPSLTPTKTVPVGGQVTFEIFNSPFDCPFVKVLINNFTSEEYYVDEIPTYLGAPIVVGMSFLALIDGQYVCVTFDRSQSNLSTNAVVEQVVNIFNNSNECVATAPPSPTPTTTPTSTMTPTQTGTPTRTPTGTPTNTPTPSTTATPGLTPTRTQTPTPSQTPTNTPTGTVTPTKTPTPTPTPNWVYVYQSCGDIVGNGQRSLVIQTVQVSGVNTIGSSFEYNSSCWIYFGRFETSFIPPTGFNVVNFNGNYFLGFGGLVYSDCSSCQNIIVSPVGCINYSLGSLLTGLPDQCGTYFRETREIVVNLLDPTTLLPKTVLSPVVITFTMNSIDCNESVNFDLPVIINVGESQGVGTFTSSDQVQCIQLGGCGLRTTNIVSIKSITPSSITEC